MRPGDNPCLSVSNRFRALMPVPGISTYGVWHPYTWNRNGIERHGARLIADHAPWRDLFVALDAEGESLSSDPVSKADEADAIVACCWRYGSYAHVLTAGELYPPFRANPQLSRTTDDEMRRINLEFSSGVAAWWADRAVDPERVHRRVRAALNLLPMPWRADRRDWWDRYITEVGGEIAESVGAQMANFGNMGSRFPEVTTLRREANYAVNQTYRNGFIERLHGGRGDHGSVVHGFLRLYAPEITKICEQTSEQMAFHLVVREHPAGDMLRRVLAHLPFSYPTGWSLSEETAPVEYPGLTQAGSLEPRLRWLAKRYPTVYHSALA